MIDKTLHSPGFSYKLTERHHALDACTAHCLGIDEKRMAVDIVFAEGSQRDGVGDLLEVAGIDTSRHRLNPIVLFDHGKQVSLPIGMAAERDDAGHYDFNKYTVAIDPAAKQARCKVYFYQGGNKSLGNNVSNNQLADHTLYCAQLFEMCKAGILGAGSIGYVVKMARELPPDFEQGVPRGAHLLSVLMLEASLTVIPANSLTVRQALHTKNWAGKRLSPVLIKSLSPHAVPRHVQLGYEPPSPTRPLRPVDVLAQVEALQKRLP
jgi:hypothetical protein